MIYRHCIPWLLILLGAAVAIADQETLSGEDLVEALRRGGYNIYFRHAATDWSRDDHVSTEGDWTSCDPGRMRQLSDEGRIRAQRIGESIRRLEIPVGRLFSSEYCRAWETATAMNLGPVEKTRAIMNMRAATFVGGREAVVERARRVLATPPPEHTNTVFVAHGNLMRAVSGAYTGEAGAVVLAPEENGQFSLVAQLSGQDWQRLAEQYADR